MGFTLIKGAFHLDAGIPDGDSVRFLADNSSLFDKLRGRRVKFKEDGTVQLRYEGIDAVEKAAIQPLAAQSRDENFKLLRELEGPSANRPRGFILTRQNDVNGRPVSFVFTGDTGQSEGEVFLDPHLKSRNLHLHASVNYKMVASGFAYTMFYTTLFMELRRELAAAFREAKSAGLGLNSNDATLTGVRITSFADLKTIPPVFPKLWRRLEEYFRNNRDLAGFTAWLRSRSSDRLNTISDQRTDIAFDNVIKIDGDTVRLLYDADDMIFIPA